MKAMMQQYLLLSIVFLAFVGISVGVPIFTPLFLNTGSSLIIKSTDYTLRSLALGLLIGLYPLGQFFGAPIIGRISDNYGRRLAMIYTLFGASIGYFITALSLHYHNIFMLMISRFITGFLEGNIAIARSSMSDISTPENKHKNFGKIAAAATAGTTIGPLLGGVLSNSQMVKFFNSSTPFYFSAIVLLILAILCKLYFIETTDIKKDHTFDLLKLSQYNLLKRINNLENRSQLKFFLLIWLLVVFVIDGFVFFLPSFLVSKWNMSPSLIAIYIALLNVWYIFGSLFLVPYVAKYLTSSKAIMIGMIFYGISLLLMLIPQNSLFLIPIFVLCDLASAIILVNGFVHISGMIDSRNQGEVMGIALGIRTLGGSIIGLFGGVLIALNKNYVIISSIALSIMVSLLMCIYMKKFNKN